MTHMYTVQEEVTICSCIPFYLDAFYFYFLYQFLIIRINSIEPIYLVVVLLMSSRIACNEEWIKLVKHIFCCSTKALWFINDKNWSCTLNNINRLLRLHFIELLVHLSRIFTLSRKRLIIHHNHFDVRCVCK